LDNFFPSQIDVLRGKECARGAGINVSEETIMSGSGSCGCDCGSGSNKVFFTDYTIADVLDIEAGILEPAGLTLVRSQCKTEEEVLADIAGVDPVAIVTQWAPVTPAVMDLCPSLKVVSRNGIGVDNIDLDYCKQRGIVVTNSPKYCTPEVADHAMSLALALVRKLVCTTDKVRAGEWNTDYLIPIRRIKECTMGVVGMGGIGRAVVERARPFFKEVIGYDPYAKDVVVDGKPVELVSLEELLTRSDVVDLHVPGSAETKHLLNAAAFARMKPSAYLVNTCRGVVVDTDALVEALRQGQIAGAGLDVFEEEPLPMDHPLRSFPEVILTPHAAFYSEEAVDDVRADTCVNIVNVLTGQPPINRIV
jgi:D-3-phosphoglycerate dehydrogenase / 2-oxoglutarate reductase